MALPSQFRERLEQMEKTRNRCFSLLQAEKELQICKSQVLTSKLSNIRTMEQRCLHLDCTIASQRLIISSLNSQLQSLESIYSKIIQNVRDLKNEVSELEESEKEKEIFYVSQSQEMEAFRVKTEIYEVNMTLKLEELKTRANELKSNFSKLQGCVNYSNSSEIADAETKKKKLLSDKENLDRILASNSQIIQQLRTQLQSILEEQVQQRKPSACSSLLQPVLSEAYHIHFIFDPPNVVCSSIIRMDGLGESKSRKSQMGLLLTNNSTRKLYIIVLRHKLPSFGASLCDKYAMQQFFEFQSWKVQSSCNLDFK